MQVRLYMTVIKNETKIYDPVSGKTQMLSPEAKPEELLGTFNTHELTAPNRCKHIIIHNKERIRLNADTLTKVTPVCTFRGEIV